MAARSFFGVLAQAGREAGKLGGLDHVVWAPSGPAELTAPPRVQQDMLYLNEAHEAALTKMEQVAEVGLDQIRELLPNMSFRERATKTRHMLDSAGVTIAYAFGYSGEERELKQRLGSLTLFMAERLLPRDANGVPDPELKGALLQSVYNLQLTQLSREYDRTLVREISINLDERLPVGRTAPKLNTAALT